MEAAIYPENCLSINVKRVKKRKMRTSPAQFQLLVEFMERNGDISKPTDGPLGKDANLHMWNQLAAVLNSEAIGDSKTIDKWKKVWSDLRNNTKKKKAKIHRAAQKTGGGPASKLRLTDLEERVLSIIGTRAATGIEEIPEVGIENDLLEVVVEETEEDSPSILQLFSNNNWNQSGTSAQSAYFPHLVASDTNQTLYGQEDGLHTNSNRTLTISSPGASQCAPQTLHGLDSCGGGGCGEFRTQSVYGANTIRDGAPHVSASANASWQRMPQSPPPVPLTPRVVIRTAADSAANRLSGGRSPSPLTPHVAVTAATAAGHRSPQTPTPLPTPPRRRRRRNVQNSNSPVQRRTRTQTQSELARQAFVRSDIEWRAFQQETERHRRRNEERWMELFGNLTAVVNRLVEILENK